LPKNPLVCNPQLNEPRLNFWHNKLVWITGASSGIGEAVSKQLAEKGARLILSSRQQEKLEQLRSTLANSDRHIVLVLDVSNSQRIKQVAEANAELLSSVDVLFNNAGISQRALTWESSAESERKLMETNFFGAIAVAKVVLPGMIKRNSGSIVVMSSASGKFGFPLRSAYAASKHALQGYFDSLRAELKGKKIYVTLVCPGRIRTNISFSALTADGTAQNSMDPGLDAGISADRCAQIMITAAANHKAEVYIGKEQVLIYLHRYIPALFRWVVQRINPK